MEKRDKSFFPRFCLRRSVSLTTSTPQSVAVWCEPPAMLSLGCSRPGTKTPWPRDREAAMGTTKLLTTCGRQADTPGCDPLAEPNQTLYKSCCENKLFQKLSMQFRKMLQLCGLPGVCLFLCKIHAFLSKFSVCR